MDYPLKYISYINVKALMTEAEIKANIFTHKLGLLIGNMIFNTSALYKKYAGLINTSKPILFNH